MADTESTTEATTENTEATGTNTEAATATESTDELGTNGVETLRKEREARKAVERELAKIKKSQMSETEKTATERDEARQEAESARAENARLRAAVKYKNLTEDDIETFLGGVPADKVDAAAKALSERIAKATPDASGAELGSGGSTKTELDPRKIAEAAAKRGGSTF